MKVTFKTYNTSLTTSDVAQFCKQLWLDDVCPWGILPHWDEDTATFTTATSGYKYRLLSKHDHWHVWCYEGADKGFMAQEWLPDFGGWEITEVEGSFGLFVGSSALLDYREVKQGSGFYKHDLIDPQAWIKRNFRRIKGEGGVLPLHETIADPIVKQYDRDLYGAR